MRICTVFGAAVTVNPWFLLFLLIFGLSGMLAQTVLAFASVLVHEAAHALAARGFGYTTHRVELLPFGGAAHIEGLSDAPSGALFAVAAAGPACSLAIAFFFYVGAPAQPVCRTLAEINLMLGCFNLLPALPLDGGRILQALFLTCMEYRRAVKCAAYSSFVVAAALVFKGAYDFAAEGQINLSLAVVAIFIFKASSSALGAARFYAMRAMARKKSDLATRGVLSIDHYAVLRPTLLSDLVHKFQAGRYAMIVILDDSHAARRTVTESEVWDALVARGAGARFGDLL